MGWLDRFIGNTGLIGEDAANADTKILNAWRKYIETVPEKKKIVHAVVVDVLRLKESKIIIVECLSTSQ